MRPERSRETGRAARVGRARLLVKADLAWLGGYPTGERGADGVAWRVPPAPGRPGLETFIDRSALHKATRALTELELRFGDVLGNVVEHPRSWLRGARGAIALLKPVVHGVDARDSWRAAPLASGIFDGDLVAAITSAPDLLRGALDAAAWIALIAPARLRRVAAFVLGHADAAGALYPALRAAQAEAATLHLALLADEDGAHRVEPLARLVASQPLYDVPTSGAEYVRGLRAGKTPPVRPSATLGRALAAWTTTILGAAPGPRRRLLLLLPKLELDRVAMAWATWWSRVDRCERLARRPTEWAGPHISSAHIERLFDGVPRPCPGDALLDALTGAMEWDEATIARRIVRSPSSRRRTNAGPYAWCSSSTGAGSGPSMAPARSCLCSDASRAISPAPASRDRGDCTPGAGSSTRRGPGRRSTTR